MWVRASCDLDGSLVIRDSEEGLYSCFSGAAGMSFSAVGLFTILDDNNHDAIAAIGTFYLI